MKTVSAGAINAITAPDAACEMKSTSPVGASAMPSIATPWMSRAIWKTPFEPNRDPILAPSRMNAAIENVPAVIAVPTLVAAMFRSVVMPAIETVSALTANDAWIWVSTTMMRGSQDVFVVTSDAVLMRLLHPGGYGI